MTNFLLCSYDTLTLKAQKTFENKNKAVFVTYLTYCILFNIEIEKKCRKYILHYDF